MCHLYGELRAYLEACPSVDVSIERPQQVAPALAAGPVLESVILSHLQRLDHAVRHPSFVPRLHYIIAYVAEGWAVYTCAWNRQDCMLVFTF